MKKVLFYIFIPVLAFFLMSHNTSAITATVTGTSGVSATVNGRTYSGSTQNNSASLFKNWDSQTAYIYNGNLTALCFDTYNPVPAGAYFSVSVRLGQYSLVNGTNTNGLGLHNTFAGFSSGANWALISQNVESLDNTYIVINVTGLVGDTASTGFCFSPANGSYIASNDVNFSNFSIVVSPVSFWITDGNGDIVSGLNDVENAIDQQTQQEQNASNDIQNQSASDIGNSTNAETQSLLSAFGSFVSAIASISPSNCMVDFDLGHIDFGEQNLCSVSVPAVFTSITSIIVIMFTIPFVYHLVNRILGLIREMQT